MAATLFNTKILLKKSIPPIFIDIYKRINRSPKSFYGVFKDFSEPKNENPWTSKEGWLTISKLKLRKVLNQNDDLLPLGYYAGLGNLVFIINHIVNKGSNKICNILDWGGAGFIYHVIKNGFLHSDRTYWHVIDDDVIMNLGKDYKHPNEKLYFWNFNEIKNTNGKFDILYINASLQYVDDYKTLFHAIITDQKYVVLTRLVAGENKVFVTSENVHGKRTPCIFLNKNEVISYFSDRGYALVFASQCDSFDGHYHKSVPPDLRIPYNINLIFEKK